MNRFPPLLIFAALASIIFSPTVSRGQSTNSAASEETAIVDSSYVSISAIKSISGEIPEDEFFALGWKFKFGEYFFSMANIDIALSNTDSDSLGSSQQKLTEAGISWNYDYSNHMSFRKDMNRALYVGGLIKIFNSEVYYGPVLGSIELPNSRLYSSYFQLAFLRRFFPLDEATKASEDNTAADHNLYAEFLIQSDRVNFFELLTVKGGILLPVFKKNGSFDDVGFRITIAIPIGNPYRFR